jgi:hypothetical protein
MFERLCSKTKTWLSRRFGDSRLPGDLTEAKLRKRIADLEQQKNQHRKALDRLKNEYQDIAERAIVAFASICPLDLADGTADRSRT